MPSRIPPPLPARSARSICVSCRRRTAGRDSTLCAACEMDLYLPRESSRSCAICGITDGRVLSSHRIGTLCANHAAIAGTRRITLAELRAECAPPGDNRSGRERRARDRRAEPDRRRRADVVAVDLREFDRRGFLAR